MNKEQKQIFIEELSSSLQDASLVIVTRQVGLTVSESTELRNKMRAAG